MVDEKTLQPAMKNKEFLEKLDNESVVLEVGKFDMEINTNHYAVRGHAFSSLEHHVSKIWDICVANGKKMGVIPVMIGTMPLSTHEETKSCLSDIERVKIVERNLKDMQEHKPIKLHLTGMQDVEIDISGISIMSNTSSFQVHFGTDFDHSARFYNASQIISGPLLAMSTNSPTLFGNELWEENRIPLFENVFFFDEYSPYKNLEYVSFGDKYLSESMLELLEENLKFHPLFPVSNPDEVNKFFHTKLLNSNVYRWNRPIIEMHGDKVHVRVENRPLPSGPTIKDMAANAAFYIGICHALAKMDIAPETLVKFESIKKNFYNAAQYGLNTKMIWFGEKELSTEELILKELIPMQIDGLRDLHIDEEAITELTTIIKDRVASGQTGSRLQHEYLKKHKNYYQGMLKIYIEQQGTGKPIHLWKI